MQSTSDFSTLVSTFATAVKALSTGMAIYLENRESGTLLDKKLKEHFKQIYPKRSSGLDPHIVEGLHRERRGHVARVKTEQPRIVQLLKMHMEEAFDQADRVASGFVLLPSPLYLAIELLTVPQEPHTRAFSLTAARLYLSHRLKVWPRNSFVDSDPEALDSRPIDENTIIEEFGNCRTWVEYGDLWSVKSDLRKSFIGHFLAMRGVLLLRFSFEDAIQFLTSGIFSASDAQFATEYRFRLSQKYEKLPPPSEYINEILGVPVALRGTDNVFFNGVKPSVSAGLVMQLAGGPGTGKTTFALALAAALAPIGTQTLYLSFEEAAGDLVSKLHQQRQPRLDKLSYHRAETSEWFNPFDVGASNLDDIQSHVIARLSAHIEESKREFAQARAEGKLLPPLPFLVVLDSLSALSLRAAPRADNHEELAAVRQRFAEFVDACREMRALVVLITADEKDAWGDLDYVVDMVIRLRVEGAESHDVKPVRLFTLSKSRQQISRHGTHIFHLSGDSGFRIAPQLSSQMDAQQYLRKLLWDRETYIEALNFRRTPSDKFRYLKFLNLHSRSQVLIQGRGSSGKAGMALKLALAPKFIDGKFAVQDSPRVLILSFLYPPSYYENLQDRLARTMRREATVSRLLGFGLDEAEEYLAGIPPVRVISLTPGALNAEDLHSMLVRHLEEGRLIGRPYTSVVIDGLHNLALQFPGASDSNYLFPILYGTLSRANVTTITTFTMLVASSEFGLAADMNEESVFRLRVHLPLLHTLVQASDYVFDVGHPETRSAKNGQGPAYLLRVQSSVSRDPPAGAVGWDRQRLDFVEPGVEYQPAQPGLELDE